MRILLFISLCCVLLLNGCFFATKAYVSEEMDRHQQHLDSLMVADRGQIEVNEEQIAALLGSFSKLEAAVKVTREVDIPDLQNKNREFEELTRALRKDLDGISKKSLRELASIIENYLQENEPETTGIQKLEKPIDPEPEPVKPDTTHAIPGE